jgi:indolepyruvate ferredoxin oxidoreductase beta subunit
LRTVNLVITGVGGQGILLLTRVLSETALDLGMSVAVSEVHGMSQRGGPVVSTLRFGEGCCPLVARGEADAILAMEPMEALRVLERASSRTVIVTAIETVPPMGVILGEDVYPPVGEIFRRLMSVTKRVYGVDTARIARSLGAPVVANIVLLGALLGTGVLPLRVESIRDCLRSHVPRRLVDVNLKALDIGHKQVLQESSVRSFL